MAEIMKMMFLVAFLLLHAESVEGYEFRLFTTNSKGTEGFVEIFYNDLWGLIGHPEFRFSDATASLLCGKFNLSLFGYGASDIYQENNTLRYFWLLKLECNENERSIDECVKTDEFRRTQFIKDEGTSLQDYGSKLYCVDYKLMGGLSPNTGMLLAAFSSRQHSMCYQGFDSRAGNVVCKHLRYNGLVDFTEGDPGLIPLYNNTLTCTGNESSLNECTMSNAVIENCTRAVYITCKAVRLTTWNEYNNEGAVEIFYNGSWGYLSSTRFRYRFNDVTAQFLCETFGFRNVGFSSGSHLLGEAYINKRGWFGYLSCKGTEADIMQCEKPSSFRFVPYVRNEIDIGTWLYCFDTDQCQSNPCLNYGTCVDGDRSYTCNCTERWSGINCEIDIDECLSQPCENNGECVNAINGLVCYCDQECEGYKQ